MSYPQIWSGQYPPDGSGTWFAVDWGLWTQDPAYNPATGKTPNKVVPQGWYFEPQLGTLFKNVPDPTLDSKTVGNVNDAINKAKRFEDTKTGQVLSSVLNYGTQFLNLLYGFKILDPAQPVTYDAINQVELDKQLKAGTLSTYAFTPAPNQAPTNSTYFGIDFSKPLNWVLVILGLYAIYTIINRLSEPKQGANNEPRQDVRNVDFRDNRYSNQGRTPTRRRYLNAA
jgi:hypothetical protein